MQLIALLSVPVPAFLGAVRTGERIPSFGLGELHPSQQHQPRWPPFAPRRGGKHVKAATHIPKNAELSIWSFDPMSKQLKTRWVNEDGSECSLLYR